MGGLRGPKVLIGAFSTVAQLGLRECIRDLGAEIVVETRGLDAIMSSVGECQPDSVVLDLDADGCIEAARRVASAFPSVKVILCSAEDPLMRIFPPHLAGDSYTATLTASSLAAEVTRA